MAIVFRQKPTDFISISISISATSMHVRRNINDRLLV